MIEAPYVLASRPVDIQFPPRRRSRDRVEQALVERFPGTVRPNDTALIPALARVSHGNFGSGLMSLLLYCNGRNPTTRSARYADGLCYCGDDAVFGVGAFVSEGGGGVHLVAPSGPGCVLAATRVAAFLTDRWPGLRVYARHLPLDLHRAMIATGTWAPVDDVPWLPSASREDETYHHRRIRLSDLIEATSEGYSVRLLEGATHREFRRKSRLAHNRFRNFLDRCRATYVLRQQTAATVPLTLDLVRGHFDDLRGAGKTPVGSSHHDYGGLARLIPRPGDGLRCLIGFLEGPNWLRPVSFFALETLRDASVGCYASITRRNPSILPATVDPRGFSAIASFALIALCQELLADGFEVLDLGGSETAELDRFKRQLGAEPAPTDWAVFRGMP